MRIPDEWLPHLSPYPISEDERTEPGLQAGWHFISSSCAGLTRASIIFDKKMDCRIKSGNDG